MEECVDGHRSASTAKVNRSITPEQKSGKEGNHTSLYGPDLAIIMIRCQNNTQLWYTYNYFFLMHQIRFLCKYWFYIS
jgi:hypothetical protein